jgi:hypothetical protein
MRKKKNIGTIKEVNIALSAIKPLLRSVNNPQVFYAEDGSRLVYYPPIKDSKFKAGHEHLLAKEYELVSPSGAKISVTNLRAFTKDIYGRNSTRFYNLYHGKSKTNSDGWTVIKD